MSFVIAVLVLAALFLAMLIPGMRAEARHPSYPRDRELMMAVKVGEELGWWPWSDLFGMHNSETWLQPPKQEQTVMRLSELARHEQRDEIKRKVETEVVTGG